MNSASETTRPRGGLRVGIQKFGSFLSGMIMPNIPALIAWGIITALFIPDGFMPNEGLESMVFPIIHYLLPLLIAVQGGRMVYEARGGVVAAIAVMGVIAGSDFLVDQFNAALPEGEDPLQPVHMFIGAMIMGPLAAWVMKWLDGLWEGKIKAGFEMLVNMFSAGIAGFLLAIGGFYLVAPVINRLMEVLGSAVQWLIDAQLLPLTSILIEPAKVFFLNNAINHGVLTPLGVAEASSEGKSVLFLLEANPGPGLGVLLAFTVFGVGAARATAPGAALIQFVGGIHEVYFPYVLMKPALLLAVVAGGATGVATNVLFGTGLRSAAAPGSIIAVIGNTAAGDYLGVILSVVLSAGVSFAIGAVILLSSRKRDAASEKDGFAEAVAKTEANKGKSSSALSGLASSAGTASDDSQAAPAAEGGGTAVATRPISKIIFACDAGMGSSAMGASVLRNKLKSAGVSGVTVTNKAIASLPGDADVVITQQTLTDRARPKEPEAVHVSVDNFMNSPRYDEVVELVKGSAEEQSVPADADSGAPAADAVTAEDGPVAEGTEESESTSGEILTLDRIRIHDGSATQADALDEAAAALQGAAAVTAEYLAAMQERERTASTYMGNELAIPHGTNDAKDAVLASALSVSRYDGGVDWDGKRVTFVIGIAGVGKEHLQILSRIARLFSDTAEVEKLKAASSEKELLQLLQAVND
ncbi:MAG TPA: PTS mannitol transporter subunit IICBA [Candidatus Nesterenkonia stercoripullorum]|uniref:Mannitol-specific phosphotransferase enzyme IIA component n=1 Tax=Candidatus Nesterenkonia stercoripullorum TaxID=2838701 RepID=A0A9D1URP5_9MICC|nr:PTS mannitol transporter subunit IICBA [Candidatus Nesterenkonia stercoripullorum]